tara:strand:+ start:1156 stop:2109 length:954 start_codon:yes stop_codon:yes gene_type:complete
MCKRLLYLIPAIAALAFAGIGVQSYLRGILAPAHDPQAMTLNYERIGHGPTKVVLLHGLTGSLQYWKKGLEYAPDDYSLLLIDLLGFGDSPKPNARYDVAEHVGAIEKVLRIEGFDSGDAFVVGHSLGAILAIGLVGEHSEWFEGLVVIGLPNFVDEEEIKDTFARISLWNQLSVDSSYQFVCYFHPLYMTEWFRPDNVPKDIFDEAKKHTWVSYYRSLDEVIVNTDLRSLVSKVQDKRILLIHGDKDAAAPVENVIALLPIFRSAIFERLEGKDHQVFLSDPAKIWALIDDFAAPENRNFSDMTVNLSDTNGSAPE